MKKTKIILPAIALLAVSGIASVTGTVAWFTAANSVKFTTGSITAVAVDSTLSVTHIGGFVNAQTSGTEGTIIEQKKDIQDSSFNANEHIFYKAAFDDVTGSSSATEADATSYYKSKDSVAEADIYCVSWISEFKTKNAEDDYDLFFDFTNSTMNAATPGSDKLQPAYRLYAAAVTTKTGDGGSIVLDSYVKDGESFVWGAGATELKYVTKAGKATEEGILGEYKSTDTVTGVIGGGSTTKATAASKKDTAHGNAGYLGTIPHGDGLKIQFVIYCEGTDAACKTANAGQAIKGSFSFYSINVNGYTAA